MLWICRVAIDMASDENVRTWHRRQHYMSPLSTIYMKDSLNSHIIYLFFLCRHPQRTVISLLCFFSVSCGRKSSKAGVIKDQQEENFSKESFLFSLFLPEKQATSPRGVYCRVICQPYTKTWSSIIQTTVGGPGRFRWMRKKVPLCQ